MAVLKQFPEPGTHKLLFRGDTIEFTLELDSELKGAAFLQTKIGNAHIRRDEVIANIYLQRAFPGQDWHDVPMMKTGKKSYSVTMALREVSHFEAKCFFVLDDSKEPLWPKGDNVHVNVEPAEYCCANSIYCAFVRQFGLNKDSNSIGNKLLAEQKEVIETLDKNNFTVIPPSGTFRDLIKELDHITGDLKCRILHLLPINPTPTVYARMGRFGSPYASLDFTAIDPSLAEFDKKATPLDQFIELVDAVHSRNAKIFIDIAINHTGWAAKIHEEHPEWLQREPDNSIHSPGAWGVTWGDLTELDHKRLDLWDYLGDMFLTWCSRGVDGFRCDAGYMIPVPAWNYIISRVRKEYPDSIFLLEGLGGDPAVTLRLLDYANMNWAYSELFQNYDKANIKKYVSYSSKVSLSDGLMVHYAETHDNSRLAGVSREYSIMRTALCALTSSNGAFGFANGVEWFATERIDVHEARSLNWGSSANQIAFISRLNSILMSHPAFQTEACIRFIDSGCLDAVALIRTDANGKNSVLILINLDCKKENLLTWKTEDLPEDGKVFTDLISEAKITSKLSRTGDTATLTLKAGQVLCLSPDPVDLFRVHDNEKKKTIYPDRIEKQCAKAVVLDMLCFKNNSDVLVATDVNVMADAILRDHVEFIESLYCPDEEVPVVYWNWPEDLRREVMIPPGHMIVMTAPERFSASIISEDGKMLALQNSLRDSNGAHFAIFTPPVDVDKHSNGKVKIIVYDGGKEIHRQSGPLLFLAADCQNVRTLFQNRDIRKNKMTYLQGNGRGAMLHLCLDWSAVRSRYDAILAGNLSVEYPEDRHIMWRRCRMWLIYHSRTHEFSLDNTEDFYIANDGSAIWDFEIPVGNGLYAGIKVSMSIEKDKNVAHMVLTRKTQKLGKHYISDRDSVCIIIRPEIEDRNFHSETKAFMGPETYWPTVIKSSEKGFVFSPSQDRALSLTSSNGRYNNGGEWTYSIYHENEAARGLEALSDLYSPGYFEMNIAGGESTELCGQIITPMEKANASFETVSKRGSRKEQADSGIESVMLRAMEHFVVKRGKLKTVIAGYPWFLDWGRDTLICARGLISAGMHDDVRKILIQFAKFADNGTIPNIIHGDNVSNRDTSDAPLWLFAASEALCKYDGNLDFLSEKASGNITILEKLKSIADGYIQGTVNGIKVDPASGLVFSPSHFSWMDTNYPAGTPREGYPIEIQSLWYAALRFLYKATGSDEWKKLAAKVRGSIEKYFVIEKYGWLADTLHCSYGTSAANAVKDDHIRPNQLFALTLKAIDDLKISKAVLKASSSLLVPGAVRSLADRKTSFTLPLYGRNGELLNNPENPYCGKYEGDEDTRRKPAYHNGTAWTWPFPSYSEAYYMVYREAGKSTARAILSSSVELLESGSVGQLPEILDGDAPHVKRGCDAQAWGITELYRVWKMLH